MTSGLKILENSGTAAALSDENGYVRLDPTTWNKDLLSQPDIIQEDIRFDQHLWMCNTPDIAWLSGGSYYEGQIENSEA